MAGSEAARAHAPRAALGTHCPRTSESSNSACLLGSTPRSDTLAMIESPRFLMVVSNVIQSDRG